MARMPSELPFRLTHGWQLNGRVEVGLSQREVMGLPDKPQDRVVTLVSVGRGTPS